MGLAYEEQLLIRFFGMLMTVTSRHENGEECLTIIRTLSFLSCQIYLLFMQISLLEAPLLNSSTFQVKLASTLLVTAPSAHHEGITPQPCVYLVFQFFGILLAFLVPRLVPLG